MVCVCVCVCGGVVVYDCVVLCGFCVVFGMGCCVDMLLLVCLCFLFGVKNVCEILCFYIMIFICLF